MKQIFYLQLDSSVTAVPGGLIQEILQRLQHLILDYDEYENSTICLESVQKQSQNNRKCESDTEWLGTGWPAHTVIRTINLPAINGDIHHKGVSEVPL